MAILTSTIYLFTLLLGTGCFLLFIEAKRLKGSNLNKEKKIACFLGWMNVSLGITGMVGEWIIEKFFW